MAKKQTKKAEVAQPEIKATNEMVEVVIEKPQPKKPKWEVKDRHYYLKNDKTPLTYTIRASNVFWFDEEKGYERELKYTTNQRTPFVDEMVGDQRLAHIVFQNGALHVPKEKTVLQKFLDLHPSNGILFEEHKPVEEAASEVDMLEFEAKAMQVALDLDLQMTEAVLRAEIGSKVTEMSSSELRRDLLVFAKRNPILFLELVTDENIQLRNFAIKAVEYGLLSVSQDQRTVSWASTGQKIMNIPFGDHAYSSLAAWFKTDEGMEVYNNIEKRLNM